MTTDDSGKERFAFHYKQLQLDDRAAWEDARSSYRRLVHLWHPDKFAKRPHEKTKAQQQFIDLTKSYNALRHFHRSHGRLPFQSEQVATRRDKSSLQDKTGHSGASSGAMDADIVASVLRRDSPRGSRPTAENRTFRKFVWVMAGGSILLGTIVFFVIVDRKANLAIAEKGRAIVKETPASEFMPSATEIRRSQTRGAFVKPTQ